MAAPRSKTRPACAKGPPASYISLICAIPTATNCAGFIASQPDGRGLKPGAVRSGRPSRARNWVGLIERRIAQPNENFCKPGRTRTRDNAGMSSMAG